MTQLADGSFRIDPASRPWIGDGNGNFMKILHVDEASGQVIYIQRFATGAQHPRHTHHCTAVAFTLSGAWCYDSTRFPVGLVAYEPYRTVHIPHTAAGETADVLVVLTSQDRGRLLEIELPGASFELNVASFAKLMRLTAEQAAAVRTAEDLGAVLMG
ncbi:MAG: cupin domain-containing protein [Sinimarinibacterium sp.]|jgi:hypothetical protein